MLLLSLVPFLQLLKCSLMLGFSVLLLVLLGSFPLGVDCFEILLRLLLLFFLQLLKFICHMVPMQELLRCSLNVVRHHCRFIIKLEKNTYSADTMMSSMVQSTAIWTVSRLH